MRAAQLLQSLRPASGLSHLLPCCSSLGSLRFKAALVDESIPDDHPHEKDGKVCLQ